MSDQPDEVVGALGYELVSQLAPEELPLYPALLRQFQDPKGGKGRGRSSDDQLLGFGAAEAVTMLTPVILSFSRSFWEALVAEAAHSAVSGILDHIKAHRPGRHEAAAATPPRLTDSQLQLVRTVAERQARRLEVPEDQAKLLADAMVGVLTSPPGP
jgi:hypothetical protein